MLSSFNTKYKSNSFFISQFGVTCLNYWESRSGIGENINFVFFEKQCKPSEATKY